MVSGWAVLNSDRRMREPVTVISSTATALLSLAVVDGGAAEVVWAVAEPATPTIAALMMALEPSSTFFMFTGECPIKSSGLPATRQWGLTPGQRRGASATWLRRKLRSTVTYRPHFRHDLG